MFVSVTDGNRGWMLAWHALQSELHVRQSFRERHRVWRDLDKSKVTIEFNGSAHRRQMGVQAYLLVAKLAGNVEDSNHQGMPELVAAKCRTNKQSLDFTG